MKKIYMTPLTEILDMETTDALAASQPSAEIEDPTIDGSRELYDALWGEEEED